MPPPGHELNPRLYPSCCSFRRLCALQAPRLLTSCSVSLPAVGAMELFIVNHRVWDLEVIRHLLNHMGTLQVQWLLSETVSKLEPGMLRHGSQECDGPLFFGFSLQQRTDASPVWILRVFCKLALCAVGMHRSPLVVTTGASLGHRTCGRSRTVAPATLPSRRAASACTQLAAPLFALPFAMVNYCPTALSGGTCTDASCSERHDIIRCEPCNCAFPPASLQQHQSGGRHLRNVAPNGAQPHPPLQTVPAFQTVPPANTSTQTPDNAENMGEGESTGITVSHDFGLEFSVECQRSDEPFATQTKELVITKSSKTPSVSFITTRVHSPDDSVTGIFSAQFEGNSNQIMPKRRHIVTVSYMPRREGLCEATLELEFHDHKRKVVFVIRRTLSGQAKRPTNGQRRRQIGPARVLQPRLRNGWWDNHSNISSDDEEEEGEELLDNGISVSDEEGLDVGIVERRRPNAPFATATSLLTIKLADGFPAVTFLEERVRTPDRGDSAFVATFEGDSRTIRPGTESTVCIIFSPKFEGLFEAELKLVFYDTRLMSRFVVRRNLQGVAGSIEDHELFETLDQENERQPDNDYRYIPPQTVIPLLQPDGRRKPRRLPDYDVPPIVKDAVDISTAEHPYERKARTLISALRPRSLTEDTYAQYFRALLNVEDGQQQSNVLCQPFYVVNIQKQKNGKRHSIEIENNDEDLLPEVILGDFVWLDDIQADIRYEARISKTEVFQRGQSHLAVLKMFLRLPTDFSFEERALFILRFRINRITLRRQYHALASLSTSLPRRLLFPSAGDIGLMQRLSRAEIDNLDLVNGNIRDDDQQLRTVVSILEQPQGSVPFIIFGPPGTGKTSALVESIMQLLRRDTGVRILACTPSNAAADLLVDRLASAGLDSDQLYRLNAYSREEDVPEDVAPFSLIPERAKLLAFRVVLSTCSSAGMLQALNVPVGHFSHIVIDEAAQAEEPLVMIPILAFSDAYTNVILAGDPNQLGPVIKSPIVSKAGLGKSFLQRLMHIREVYGLDTQVGKTIVALQRNRRSHGAIIAWPNRYLYEDIMHASGDVDVTHLLVNSGVLPKKGFPIVFHGIKGSEKRTRQSPSYFNVYEASLVRNYCVALTSDSERNIYPEDIGVIAPYKAQVRTIREFLKQAKLSNISVGSVEQFQGQERKVIIMATTRSNEEVHPRKALGFLMNPRRMNVAITRAQSLLILVGDPGALGKDKFWRTFLNYITSHHGSTGKLPSWRLTDVVPLFPTEVIPRERVLYGEEFIDGKSENIYRYNLGDG